MTSTARSADRTVRAASTPIGLGRPSGSADTRTKPLSVIGHVAHPFAHWRRTTAHRRVVHVRVPRQRDQRVDVEQAPRRAVNPRRVRAGPSRRDRRRSAGTRITGKPSSTSTEPASALRRASSEMTEPSDGVHRRQLPRSRTTSSSMSSVVRNTVMLRINASRCPANSRLVPPGGAALANRYARWYEQHPRDKTPPMESAPTEVTRARGPAAPAFEPAVTRGQRRPDITRSDDARRHRWIEARRSGAGRRSVSQLDQRRQRWRLDPFS